MKFNNKLRFHYNIFIQLIHCMDVANATSVGFVYFRWMSRFKGPTAEVRQTV